MLRLHDLGRPMCGFGVVGSVDNSSWELAVPSTLENPKQNDEASARNAQGLNESPTPEAE